jgi:phosphopentomutase
MSNKFIVLVIDSFGIGAMDDIADFNPNDIGCNTFKSIIKAYPETKFSNMEKLGLMNAAGFESQNMKYSKNAIFGSSKLMHFGADSFMGHQEIVGSKPKLPLKKPFNDVIDEVANLLIKNNHKVEYKGSGNTQFLLVDDYATIADNIDTAPGMAYNITAPLDYIDFENELVIAKLVREIATVNRVICFGGRGNTVDDLLNAVEKPEEGFIGVVAVKSKSYIRDYHCIHLGYGVNENVQVSKKLANKKIKSYFIGKTADIVANTYGESISMVSTDEVMKKIIKTYKSIKEGFIFSNVQETDLAGHSEDALKYKNLLEICDKRIGELIGIMDDEDILIVMADHGNDPGIGHNQHTREKVPLLIHYGNKKNINLGIRETMSDVGATIAEYFKTEEVENGKSFLNEML